MLFRSSLTTTRDGGTVSLTSLLNLAEQEATPEIALAAIKYADLSSAIHKDYVFDAERMVQTTGDTGPYLQYAHARICQILRRAEAENIGWNHRKQCSDHTGKRISEIYRQNNAYSQKRQSG